MTGHPTVPDPETLLAHRDWLRAIARGLVRDENDVDEVEQATWLAVLRNDRPVGSVRGWLRSIVRSVATDRHRAESRRSGREARAARTEAVPSTLHLVAEADAQRAVAEAVLGLPEPYRSTVLLRYFEDRTPTEIAARCGVPVETVKTRLRRALAMLREALDRERGGRRAWMAAVLPLTKAARPAPTIPSLGGGLAVGASKKLAVIAAALLATVAGTTWILRDGLFGEAYPVPEGSDSAVADTDGPRPRDVHVSTAQGRVRGRHDGLPIAGARVSFEPRRGAAEAAASSVTDSDGSFALPTRGAGVLRIVADGWCAAAIDVTRPASPGAPVDLGDVWLDSAECLIVEVTGPDDAPVARASVTLRRRADEALLASTHRYLWARAAGTSTRTSLGTVPTDRSGRATFEPIAPGHFDVLVRAPGFAGVEGWYADVLPRSGVTRARVRLAPAYRLAGRVLTAAGVPVPGRVVQAGIADTADPAVTTSQADGGFVLENVAAGDVPIAVGRGRGAGVVVATVRVPDVAWVEAILPPSGSASGRVTRADGSPVPGAAVGLETAISGGAGDVAVATTDADGEWRIPEISAGRLQRFEVRRAGWLHEGPRLESSVLVTRRSGPPAGIEATVVAGRELRLDARMSRGARLHGRVTGPEGGLGGAWVTVRMRPTRAGQEWETAVCDADGRYSFDALPAGDAAAVAMHPGYIHPDAPDISAVVPGRNEVAASLRLDLRVGADVERDFELVPGARIAGRVVDASGRGVAGAVVVCRKEDWFAAPPTAAVSDDSGAFVIARAAVSGQANVLSVAPGRVQERVVRIDVPAGGAVDAGTVRLAEPSAITGRVLSDDGLPVRGALVSARLASWDGFESRPALAASAPDGRYSLQLPRAEGEFIVRASAPGHGECVVRTQVRFPGVSADLRLGGACIAEGVVLSDSGDPVVGASVVRLDPVESFRWFGGDLTLLYGATLVVHAITDESGRFRVSLPRGERRLLLRAAGFVDGVATIDAPSPGPARITLRRPVTLAGRLADAAGRPLSGAVLRLHGGRGAEEPRFRPPAHEMQPMLGTSPLFRRTDAAGEFSFDGLPDAEWFLHVQCAGGAEWSFGPLRADGSPHLLTASNSADAALSGRILDAAGMPFIDAEASLRLLPEAPGATASSEVTRHGVPLDRSGAFRIDGVPAGCFTIHMTVLSGRTAGRSPDGREFPVSPKVVTRSFHGVRVPGEGQTFRISDGATSGGRLVGEDGVPLAGWTVTAAATPLDGPKPAYGIVLAQSARTGSDGRFELRGLEERDLVLSISCDDAPGRRIVGRREFRGGSGLGDVVATLEMRIRGRVVDRAGAPVARAAVSAMETSSGRNCRTRTAADGSFELTGLAPGSRYYVGVDRADGTGWSHSTLDPANVRTAGDSDVVLVRE